MVPGQVFIIRLVLQCLRTPSALAHSGQDSCADTVDPNIKAARTKPIVITNDFVLNGMAVCERAIMGITRNISMLM